jgi:uncharacterized membrane protein YjjP (DUF1212 family)
MAYEELRDVISLSLWAGQMLLQWGADTQRVEETVHHIGTGLGCDWLDIVVTPDAIIASTINNHDFRTKVRRAPARGVNMSLIAEVNSISHRIDAGELDRFGLREELRRIDHMPHNYNRWVVVVAVGLACAAFARLFGGSPLLMVVTFFASACATFTRQEMHKRHFNTILTTTITAFIAALIASVAVTFQLSERSSVAIAAAVLLLVPGVPLINAIQDLIKGYTMNGVARGVYGGILALAIALGISIALWVTGLGGVWRL